MIVSDNLAVKTINNLTMLPIAKRTLDNTLLSKRPIDGFKKLPIGNIWDFFCIFLCQFSISDPFQFIINGAIHFKGARKNP